MTLQQLYETVNTLMNFNTKRKEEQKMEIWGQIVFLTFSKFSFFLFLLLIYYLFIPSISITFTLITNAIIHAKKQTITAVVPPNATHPWPYV